MLVLLSNFFQPAAAQTSNPPSAPKKSHFRFPRVRIDRGDFHVIEQSFSTLALAPVAAKSLWTIASVSLSPQLYHHDVERVSTFCAVRYQPPLDHLCIAAG